MKSALLAAALLAGTLAVAWGLLWVATFGDRCPGPRSRRYRPLWSYLFRPDLDEEYRQ